MRIYAPVRAAKSPPNANNLCGWRCHHH